MSALSEARERREAIESFRDRLPWFEIKCSSRTKPAPTGVDIDRAYERALGDFNEMCTHIKRDLSLCDEVAAKLLLAYEAFKRGDEPEGKRICDELWRMPELKKMR